MSNDLSTPFANIIAQAAKTAPQTGAVEAATERINTRTRRQAGAGVALVLLCDVSSSMNETAGAVGRSKWDILRSALDGLWAQLQPQQPRVVAFSSTADEVRHNLVSWLPAPAGGTALHLGLRFAATYPPRHTIVISDGRPDDEEAAIEEAEKLPGTIDVIYCGPDSDQKAIAFMRRLARVGGGSVQVHDIKRAAQPQQALTGAVRTLLALPAPPGEPRP